jgi:NitT/TauT family transport system substrate-binding protein
MLNRNTRRWRWVMVLLPALLMSISAHADTATLRIAQQFGSASLPLIVMQHEGLIEKRAAAEGRSLKTEWFSFSGGNVMNDALLSGSLDLATAGISPLLTIWDKTRTTIGVKGIASLGSVPFVLVSTDPGVNTIKDLTSNDRIAVPAAKVSIQAVVLQMAAAKVWGAADAHKLDVFTVSMKHPDAVAALVGGGTEVNGHVSSSPYYEYELKNAKNAHVILSSLDVTGPSTNVALYTTTKFYDANPDVLRIVLAALGDANDLIAKDHAGAVRIYKEVTKEKYADDFLIQAFFSGANIYTTTPQGFEKFAAFMNQNGNLKNVPASWKDVFFPLIHAAPGN